MPKRKNLPYTHVFCAILLACSGCTGIMTGSTPEREAPAAGGSSPSPTTSSGGSVAQVTEMFSPSPPALPRLTTAQYRNVIFDLFGPRIEVPELEPDQRPYSFSIIGASTTTVSEHGVDLYGQAAFQIAKAVFADETLRARVVGCSPQTPLDDACLDEFLESFGLRAWRRPLTNEELARYRALAASIGPAEPWAALQYVTAALLQSPNFLYRVELGETQSEKASWLRYGSYETASRLSFLLRNSAPDAELLKAAADDSLQSREGILAAAKRLLDDTGPTEAMLSALYSEYLDLPLLDEVQFPADMDPGHTLAASMRGEVLEIVNRIGLREGGDMRELFTTTRVATNSDLSPLYGLPTSTTLELSPTELPAGSKRAGILTTGALLTLNNRPNRTSPTIRGLFIRQRLLCGTVPPPPPGIPAIKDEDAGAPKTIREKLEQHRSNPACAACHQSMDPIGLGMEDFDQYGRFRSTYEGGQPVDSAGDVDGVPFDGAKDLGAVLAADPRTMACLVKQLYRYGAARLETATEASALKELTESFGAQGHQLRPLLLSMVTSDAFRFTVEDVK